MPCAAGLLVAVSLLGSGAPARGASLDLSLRELSVATARTRLFDLARGEGAQPPESPRYLAIESAARSGFVLIMGWVLPGISADDERALEAVACTLGGQDGWLSARLVKTGQAERVSVWLERQAGIPWLGVEVKVSGRATAKAMELAVLEAIGVLGAQTEAGGAAAAASKADLEPAAVGRAVRRWLTPRARAVVELHAKDAPAAPIARRAPSRHVVAAGDTLTHIAARHGLDLDALVRLNGIDPALPIHPGDELRLSAKGARRPKIYVVKSGDTLAKVARRFGLSQKRLVEFNRLSDRKVKPGQKLVLPP